MRYKFWLVVFMLGFCVAASAQMESDEFDLEAFLEQIEINLVSPLRDRGAVLDNRQWAMILGYALRRQATALGDFEIDRARMNNLMEDVKEFLIDSSSDENLWAVTLEALNGRYENEVLQIFGGSFSFQPIFTSIGGRSGDDPGLQGDFDSHPDRDRILSLAEKMLTHLRNKEYALIDPMLGGRMVQEFRNWISQIESDPEKKAEMEKTTTNLEWTFDSSKVTGGDPPRVDLRYAIKSDFSDWQYLEFTFLLDGGAWKIIRFEIED